MFRPHSQVRLRKRPLGRYRYVRLRWRVLFTAIDFVGGLLFGILRLPLSLWERAGVRGGARFHRARHVENVPHGKEDPRAILLVQLDHLGDAIITTVMLPALRRRYPTASIEVLVGAWNRELFEAMPEIDRVHVSRVNRFSRTGRFGWALATLWWGLALRRRQVDLAIDTRGEFPLAVILWLCGARTRVGWDCGGGGFLLTHSPRYVPNRPETQSRLALLAELGIDSRTPRPAFRPPEQARGRVDKMLARQLPENGGCEPPIVLHIGAGTEAKRWPVPFWRELAGRLIVEHGRQVVLVGGPGDRIIARELVGSDPWPGLIDWTGQLGLVELAALLERAELLVGADSGPAHLAAAVGTPVVVLFSGTNNRRQWRPRGDRVTILHRSVACSPCHRQCCPLADHPCMGGLRPEAVLAAVEQTSRSQAPPGNALHGGSASLNRNQPSGKQLP